MRKEAKKKAAVSVYRLMKAQQRRAATANFQNETAEANRRHNKKLELAQLDSVLFSRPQPGMIHNQQFMAHRRQALLAELANSLLP